MPIETEQRVFVKFTTGEEEGIKDPLYLVIVRGPGGNNPGQYGLPGGHLNEGESLEEGARRECLEELGVDINFKACLWRETHIYGKRAIISLPVLVSFAYRTKPSPAEVASLKWMTRTEIESIPPLQRHKSLSVAFF